MSTPISQLPATAPPSAPPVSDPEVLNVLQEMEAEVAKATLPMAPPPMHMSMHHPMQMSMPPTMVPIPIHKESKGWIDVNLLQNAGIFAAVATIIFYPATLQLLYARIPSLEAIFHRYDPLIRFAVLLVVMYFLLLKFKN